jgi:hypothetical protein
MNKWLRRIRGAIGMGLTWAAGWAVFGILIGVTSLLLPGLPWDAFFDIFDAPLPALAMPGFIGGALFSFVLSVAGRNRRFDELSVPRFAIWGAAGGLLLSLIPGAMVTAGLATIGKDGRGVWDLTTIIAGPLMLLCSASAAGSLILARKAQGGASKVSDTGPGSAGSSQLSEDTLASLASGSAVVKGQSTGDTVQVQREP